MVTAEQFKNGVDRFFTAEVFPKLPEGKRFVAAFGCALILGNIEKQPILRSLGLIADGGMIDVERAYVAAKTAANVAPLIFELPVLGTMRFTASDIEMLYQFIMG